MELSFSVASSGIVGKSHSGLYGDLSDDMEEEAVDDNDLDGKTSPERVEYVDCVLIRVL